MKLSAKQYTACLVLFSGIVLAACQGRSKQAVVVDKKDANAQAQQQQQPQQTLGAQGTQPGALPGETPKDGGLATGAVVPEVAKGDQTADPNAAAATAAAAGDRGTTAVATGAGSSEGKTYVNGWTGADDEIPADAGWVVKSVAGAAAAATTATTATTATATAATGLTDAEAVPALQGSCGKSNCHGGAVQPNIAGATAEQFKAAIKARNDMLGKAGLDSAKYLAWANGTGGSAPAAAAASTPTINLREDAAGNCLNTDKVSAKVGQTVTFVNNCKSGYIPHTNGAPFPHGSQEIPPGGKQDFRLDSAYDSSSRGMYRHTDGSDNSQNQPINLDVTN